MRTEDYEQKAIDFMEKTGTKIYFKRMKEMIRYAARQISLDIFRFLLNLNIKPEKDNYLVDLFNYK